MRRTDYADIIYDLFNARLLIENNKLGNELLELIEDRLLFLNACIDAKDSNIDEQEVIGIAYLFYRMRERYLDLSNSH